jgi:hypothetical protein
MTNVCMHVIYCCIDCISHYSLAPLPSRLDIFNINSKWKFTSIILSLSYSQQKTSIIRMSTTLPFSYRRFQFTFQDAVAKFVPKVPNYVSKFGSWAGTSQRTSEHWDLLPNESPLSKSKPQRTDPAGEESSADSKPKVRHCFTQNSCKYKSTSWKFVLRVYASFSDDCENAFLI